MYSKAFADVDVSKYSFLVTGGAGFIGSHLVEYLVKYNAKKIVVLDNLSTGFKKNIQEYTSLQNFKFIEGDICNFEKCKTACNTVDFVFHQAALGSVPRSVENPLATMQANTNGFVTLLTAAKDEGVKRIVYASSSSVYGDISDSPKRENSTGNLLSPYAASKMIDEVYGTVFAKAYNMEIIGLRYFNIFGPRQNPKGAYAAAIPLFIESILNQTSPVIYGDGNQSRDFTFVSNAVQANIKAMFAKNINCAGDVFNVANGKSFSVNNLVGLIKKILNSDVNPTYKPARKGEVKDSLADISKAKKAFAYVPEVDFEKGVEITINSFKE